MPTLEFNTTNEKAFKYFRPLPSKMLKPDWWKELKPIEFGGRVNVNNTIKICPAMVDWLNNGYYITTCTDIHVEYHPNGINHRGASFNWIAKMPEYPAYETATHPRGQFKDCEYAKEDHTEGDLSDHDAVKIKIPWGLKTPLGYSTMYLDPWLFQNRSWQTWQGIIDTDTYTGGDLNGLVIIYPKIKESFIIPKGTPIVQVVPYKRENWKAAIRLQTAAEHVSENCPFDYHQKKNEADQNRDVTPYLSDDKYWQPKQKLFDSEIEDYFNLELDDGS